MYAIPVQIYVNQRMFKYLTNAIFFGVFYKNVIHFEKKTNRAFTLL